MKKINFFVMLFLAVVMFSTSSCKKSLCKTYYQNGNVKAEWYAYDCSTGPGMYDQVQYYDDPYYNGGGGGVNPYDPTIDWSVFHVGTFDFVVDDPLYVGGAPTSGDLNTRLILANINQDAEVDFESGGPANHYCIIYGWAGGYRAATVVDQNLLIGSGKYRYIRNGTIIPGAATYSNVHYGTKGNPATWTSRNFPSGTPRYYMLLE